ncbi:bifunctional metallophosphatase/5'-nucleotidase [Luteipulveratus mongoliensis]|uniref:5'-Nucleotidase C-terminal domain-containing protein n=1 Tax=Luteipulveratus mongoliensis TaxID=571913 RepID=A0A0K1JNP8_9MICO|nr:5'-nucleotidase C-terminal domain-containing protein [Luteipulveratus mongoliensis]AKU18342.1 hypothetical protein VV02_25010 [Luteipulveratus mongoliensis]
MPTLELLHWNDVHGRYDSLARLSAYAKTLRSRADHATLLLDCGDIEEATVRVSALSYGVSGWRVLRACGVDVAVTGNGGLLRYGPMLLPRYAESLGSPLLLANVTMHGDVPQGAARSRMLQAGELKVGVIGVTGWLPAYGDFGLERHATEGVVREEAEGLRSRGADVVVLLSHCGVEKDREAASRLTGVVDVIVGGRTHLVLPEGDRDHGVPVAQAGQYAEHLGRIRLDVDDAGRVSVPSIAVERVSEEAPQDPEVLAVVQECERDLEAWLAEPVATLPRAFGHSETGHSEVAQLVAHALLEYIPGDLSMVLAARCTAGLPSGRVTRGDVWAATSSPANPTTATMLGSHLRSVLLKGRSQEYAMTRSDVFRGRPYGQLHLASAEVAGETVMVRDEPLDDQRIYRVVSTDVELGRWGRLVGQIPDDLVIHTPTIVPEFLEAYLRATYP